MNVSDPCGSAGPGAQAFGAGRARGAERLGLSVVLAPCGAVRRGVPIGAPRFRACLEAWARLGDEPGGPACAGRVGVAPWWGASMMGV